LSRPETDTVDWGALMQLMLKILAVVLVVVVFIYSWYRNDLRRLTRDFACKDPVDGASGTLHRAIST
jgi:hypothetical protein